MKTPSAKNPAWVARRSKLKSSRLPSRHPQRHRRLLLEQLEDRRVLATAVNDSFSFYSSESFNGNTWSNDDYQWSSTSSVYNYETQEWEHSTQYATGWIESPPSFAASFHTAPEGYFQYTAIAGFSGTDSFTYTICDIIGCSSATATLTVTIEPPPPIAADDSYTATAGFSLIVPAAEGLLANDSSPSGQPLSAMVVTTTGNGSLAVSSDGGFTYVPAPGFMGTDTFVYSASDGLHTTNATVTLVVVDESPTLNEIPNPTPIDEDSPAQTIQLSGISNGGGINQALTVTATSSLTSLIPNPTVSYTSPNTSGSLSYTPLANQSGTATIRVWVHDAGPAYALRTFNVTINPVNDAPVLSGANRFTTIAADQTNNNGNLVSMLIAGKVADVDSGAVTGIAVTGLSAETGSWEYSLNHGGTWSSVGAVSNASGLLLRSTDRLRFVPDGLDAASASVTMRAWDQTSGAAGTKVDVSTSGGATAFSTASTSSPITVMAVMEGFDVAVNGFYSDGANLKVQYFVAGGPTPSFKIGIYASSDGSTPGQLLQFVNGYVNQGFYAETIAAAFPDLPHDYYLVAKVDSAGQVAEVNEDNNLARFAGGSFINHQSGGQTILEVHGTDADDPISVSTYTYQVSHTVRIELEPERWEEPVINEDLIRRPVCVEDCETETPVYFPPETEYDPGWCNLDPCVLTYYPPVYGDVTNTTTETAWRLTSAQSHAGVPSTAAGPPYYDVSGNGIVDPFDAAAAFANNFTWHNDASAFDIDGDGVPSPADALSIINLLNTTGEQVFSGVPAEGDLLLDATRDGYLSVLDAAAVMDKLNGGSGQVTAPWRNDHAPGDVNADNQVDADDVQAVMAYLAVHQIDYTALAIDQIRIRAHGGHDLVAANGAAAWIFGGAGNDSLTGGAGADVLTGGDGADLLSGGYGADVLTGGDGPDLMNGGAGTDSLQGNADNDQLFGGLGNDTLDGGEGDDILLGNAGSSLIPGGQGGEGEGPEGESGEPQAEGEGASDDDGLHGGEGNDGMYGEEGDDSLIDDRGNNRFHGGPGIDTINGATDPDDNYLASYPPEMRPCYLTNVVAPVGLGGGGGQEGGSGRLSLSVGNPHPSGGIDFGYPLDLHIKVDLIAGTATAGADYGGPTSFEVRVPGSWMSPDEPRAGYAYIPFPADAELEPLETFSIRMEIMEYPICGTRTVPVTIRDTTVIAVDDHAEVLKDTPIAITNLTLNDQIMTDDPEDPISHPFLQAIRSFTQPEHGTVEWYSTFQTPHTHLVYTPDDGYVGDDSFTYTVKNGGCYDWAAFQNHACSTDTATVDLSVGGTVNIEPENSSAAILENGPENEPTFARFRVWLSEEMDHTVYVEFATQDLPRPDSGTPEERARARSGYDFTPISKQLVFQAGQTEQFIDIPILDDDIDEYTEPLGVQLRNPFGISSGQMSATKAITDDDDSPELSISSSSVTEPEEGDTSATINVTLSRPSEKEISVGYQTQQADPPEPEDGWELATNNEDYTGGASTAALPPEFRWLSIPILSDDEIELPEVFEVVLTSATEATFSSEPSLVTITDVDKDDDDAEFKLLGPGDISADTHQAAIAALFSLPDTELQELENQEVTFTINDGVSAPQTQTVSIHDGAAVLILNTATVAGRHYQVEASFESHSDSDSFKIVSGSPYSIVLTPSKSALKADTTDTLSVDAVIRDQWGNLVEDGTSVTWLAENGANAFINPGSNVGFDGELAFVSKAAWNGHSTVTVRAPAMANDPAEPFTITLDAGSASVSLPITILPVSMQIDGPSNLDRATSQFGIFTVTANAPNGTPVYWTVSNANPSFYEGVIIGGGATFYVTTHPSLTNVGPCIVTATVGSVMAVHALSIMSSNTFYVELDRFVIAGDDVADGSDTIQIPGTPPLIDAQTGVTFASPNPAFARNTTYNYYASATLTIHGVPNQVYAVNLLNQRHYQYIEFLEPQTDLPISFVTLNGAGIGHAHIRSLGALPGGDAFNRVGAFVSVTGPRFEGGPNVDEDAKLEIVEHNWWTRTKDGVSGFFGGDPQTVAGMGANVAGGMLIVGDVGSLVKNAWRGLGFSNKSVNYAEVTLSALGIATEIAVGAGEVADLPISQVRAIVAAFGNTKFTKVLVILLKRALSNAQDMLKFGKLVGKMFTSEAAMQIAQKVFTSEQALKEGIEAFERFGDRYFESLHRVGKVLYTEIAARRLSFVLGNLSEAATNALKQLSAVDFKIATDSMGKMFHANRVNPELLLSILNDVPNQILTSPTRLVTMLSDMALIANVKGFKEALEQVSVAAKYEWKLGRLYEFRVAAYFKQLDHSVEFIDEFVKAAGNLTSTDIDIVANGIYYQVKSSAAAFGTGQAALDDVIEWVAKAKKHAQLKGIAPVIKYVVPDEDMIPEAVKQWFVGEGIQVIEVAF